MYVASIPIWNNNSVIILLISVSDAWPFYWRCLLDMTFSPTTDGKDEEIHKDEEGHDAHVPQEGTVSTKDIRRHTMRIHEWEMLYQSIMRSGFDWRSNSYQLPNADGGSIETSPSTGFNNRGFSRILECHGVNPHILSQACPMLSNMYHGTIAADLSSINLREQRKLVREMEKNVGAKNKPASQATVNKGKLQPLNRKRHQHAIPLACEAGMLWCFVDCSRSVKGFVFQIGRLEFTRIRVAQLIGLFRKLRTIDDGVAAIAEKCVNVFAQQHLLFDSAWESLELTVDKKKNEVPLNQRLQFRSIIAKGQIHVAELIFAALYPIERIAYGEAATDECVVAVQDILGFAELEIQSLPIPYSGDLNRDIRRLMYTLVKEASKHGFAPYRLFLGTTLSETGNPPNPKAIFNLYKIMFIVYFT